MKCERCGYSNGHCGAPQPRFYVNSYRLVEFGGFRETVREVTLCGDCLRAVVAVMDECLPVKGGN